MFDKNIITFNPGWGTGEDHHEEFADIRQIQRSLKGSDPILTTEADESTTGPACLTLIDQNY